MMNRHKSKINILLTCLTLFCALTISLNVEAKSNNNEKLQEQFQKILNSSLKKIKGTGVVCLIRTPTFQWIGSSGYSNKSKKIPMTPNDKLRIASMTKTYASVVVLKLCEEGKLRLDDKIKKYLPSDIISNIPHAQNITIKQLLGMTSGIRSYTEEDSYNDAVEDNPYRIPWQPYEIVKYIYKAKPGFSPGKGWDYSNTNYILLEIIVKSATGNTLAKEMRRIIHNPLNLKNTFMEIQEPRKGGFGGLTVRGYSEYGEDVTEIQDALGLADGGLISTASDVADFMQALLLDKKLLNPEYLSLMKTLHKKEDYGLGLEYIFTKHGTAWGHNGCSSGFSGEMLYLPDKKLIFVLLTNDENDSKVSETAFDEILKILSKTTIKNL